MTYSVVARDPATGDIGVAVQSHFFAVGAVVPWARAGVGAVATQFVPDTRYGRLGLDAMQAGRPARDALASLVADDEHPELRQVAMIDARGEVAVHSGDRCIAAAGSRVGDGWSVQGNVLDSPAVLDAMAAALAGAAEATDLPHRLVAALRAGEDAGGDVRGSQAAALLVVSADAGTDPLIDLRVDDAQDPVSELERLLHRHDATTRMGPAIGLVIAGDERGAGGLVDDALAGLSAAEAALGADNPEIPLWRAVLLARAGRITHARSAFRVALDQEPRLHDIGARLADVGLISTEVARTLTP